MMAAFPGVSPLITGEPTTGELVYILQHLMACAQSYQSDISLLNLLYGCILEAYSINPTNPEPTPIFLQDRWLILQKRINNGIIYTLFAQHATFDKDVVDMTMQVILNTGLFVLEYGE